MGWTRRTALGAIATGAALAVLCAPAGATTTIGETFTPVLGSGMTEGNLVQTVTPSNSYAAPSAGVITSWSYHAPAMATPPLRLKFYRRVGSTNDYLIIGRSPFEVPTASMLNTFETRISVHAGDLIGGGYSNGFTLSGAPVGSGYDVAQLLSADPPPGTTATFQPVAGLKLDLSAQLEPDADHDGYGDETQDQCPLDPTSQLPPCVSPAVIDKTPPDTIIDAKPAVKTKARLASFAFHATEAGASFKCSVDGGPFAGCASPKAYTVGKGRHTFQVFAKDAAGNVDDSPAFYAWTVKKKKKKRH
jgi:hypothetical protein